MENRVRLEVLGITYNQIQNGAYVLVLAEMDGPRRIPIVIGTAEAQSIVMRLGNKIPPRPMTHDLFVSFAHGFGVRLVEVFIYSFKDGIFASELLFDDGERQMRIDSRTSDAIAIALRTQSPILYDPGNFGGGRFYYRGVRTRTGGIGDFFIGRTAARAVGESRGGRGIRGGSPFAGDSEQTAGRPFRT